MHRNRHLRFKWVDFMVSELYFNKRFNNYGRNQDFAENRRLTAWLGRVGCGAFYVRVTFKIIVWFPCACLAIVLGMRSTNFHPTSYVWAMMV